MGSGSLREKISHIVDDIGLDENISIRTRQLNEIADRILAIPEIAEMSEQNEGLRELVSASMGAFKAIAKAMGKSNTPPTA